MKMGNYSEEIFLRELGKPLDDLWKEYLIFRSSYFSK
jgi:hypothetical protein